MVRFANSIILEMLAFDEGKFYTTKIIIIIYYS